MNELMNENVYYLKFATFVNENNGHVYVYVIYMKINVVYWKQMFFFKYIVPPEKLLSIA